VLLAADIVLPLPSSIICATAGAFLDFVPAVLSMFAGLMASSLIGYELGRRFGRQFAEKIAGRRLRLPMTIGATLCLTRPVPVLSEAMAVLAGAGSVPIRTFLLATGLSNLGVAICYALLGAAAQDAGGFLLVLAASLVVPAGGYAVYWLVNRSRSGLLRKTE
jgi:uncharacterized membrane protein YdjX (TVP38/TMEM64 family)